MLPYTPHSMRCTDKEALASAQAWNYTRPWWLQAYITSAKPVGQPPISPAATTPPMGKTPTRKKKTGKKNKRLTAELPAITRAP
jgi:hypothetical protein